MMMALSKRSHKAPEERNRILPLRRMFARRSRISTSQVWHDNETLYSCSTGRTLFWQKMVGDSRRFSEACTGDPLWSPLIGKRFYHRTGAGRDARPYKARKSGPSEENQSPVGTSTGA